MLHYMFIIYVIQKDGMAVRNHFLKVDIPPGKVSGLTHDIEVGLLQHATSMA